MQRYIDHFAKTKHRTKVSSEYGQPPKGTKGKGEYVVVASKDKDRCDSVSKIAKVHRWGQSEYKRSPAEKAKLKAERKKSARN